MHFRPEAENNPGAFDAIAHSQFSIAQTILNTPNAEVFAEGVYDNTITSEEYEKQLKDPKSAAHLCNAIFPSGFPTSFDLLTERQKFALVRLGAPEVLWLLGAIIHVHGTIDSSVRMLIDIEAEAIEKYGSWDKAYQLSPEFRYEIGTEREEVAEAHITSFMRSRSYKGQPILLVFGSDHDFSAFAQKRTWLNVLSALSKGQIK